MYWYEGRCTDMEEDILEWRQVYWNGSQCTGMMQVYSAKTLLKGGRCIERDEDVLVWRQM